MALAFLPPAAAHDLAGDWAAHRGDASRLGAVLNAGPTSATLSWSASFALPDTASTDDLSSPIIADGKVFLQVRHKIPSGAEARAHGFDLATGNALWPAIVLNRSVAVGGALSDGRWYVVSNDAVATVYAIDVQQGSVAWRRTLPKLQLTSPQVTNAPAVSGGNVFVVANDGTVHALAAATGDVRWSARSGPRSPNTNSLAVWDGRGYFGVVGASGCDKPCSNDFVYGIDLADGRDLWAKDPTDATSTDDDIGTAAAAIDGRVFIASRGFAAFTDPDGTHHPAAPSRLFALDAHTGRTLWQRDSPGGNFGDVSVRDGTLYVAASGGLILVLDASTGRDRRAPQRHDAEIHTAVTLAGEVLYFGTSTEAQGVDRRVRGVAVADGHEVFQAPIAGLPKRAPAVAEGRLAQVSLEASTTVLSVFGTAPGTHATNAAPQIERVTPHNGATSRPTALGWKASDPDPNDPLRFDVHFGRSATPPLVANLIAADSWPLPALAVGETYHWRIVARDSHGAASMSDVSRFTYADGPATSSSGTVAITDAAPPKKTGSTPGMEWGLLALAVAATLIVRRR